MASNKIPQSPLESVFTLASVMADGALRYEAAIGIKQNTNVEILADVMAAHSAESAYQAARSAKKGLTETLSRADDAVTAFLSTAKKVLSVALGNQWSQAWAAVGWTGHSLAIPTTHAQRVGMLPLLHNYFVANPTRENAALGVTAIKTKDVLDAVLAAEAAVNEGDTAAATAKAARDAAVDTLHQRMLGLVHELGQLLDDNDARWYAFGLNRPSDPETPSIPDMPDLSAGVPGTVKLYWPPARRADRYKVQKQVVGVDVDFVEALQTPADYADITGLTSGATLKVRVIACNAAGDSQPGPDAQITVP